MTTIHHRLCFKASPEGGNTPCICEPDHVDGRPEDCPAGECMICAVTVCPQKEPLHYHHDGCPACDVGDESQEGK